MALRELALFSGAGGGILAGKFLGWKTVAAVEFEDYPRRVLLQRQRDGLLRRFPIWDDVCTFDGLPWRGAVDIVSGGFPCQDISIAGRGAGIGGERSGLWSEMARIIGEVRPRFAFVENSPALTFRGLGTVLGDLSALGYDARWITLGADDAGAPHRRKRIWILAYSSRSSRSSEQRQQQEIGADRVIGGSEIRATEMAYSMRDRWIERGAEFISERWSSHTINRSFPWYAIDPAEISDSYGERLEEFQFTTVTNRQGRVARGITQVRGESVGGIKPGLGRVAHGMADRMDIARTAFGGQIPRVEKGLQNRVSRLKAIGNGQVPVTAVLAFITLSEGLI